MDSRLCTESSNSGQKCNPFNVRPSFESETFNKGCQSASQENRELSLQEKILFLDQQKQIGTANSRNNKFQKCGCTLTLSCADKFLNDFTQSDISASDGPSSET